MKAPYSLLVSRYVTGTCIRDTRHPIHPFILPSFQFVYLSSYIFIHQSVLLMHPSSQVNLSNQLIYPSIHLTIYPSTYSSNDNLLHSYILRNIVYSSIHPFIKFLSFHSVYHVSILLSIHQFINPYTHPPIHLSTLFNSTPSIHSFSTVLIYSITIIINPCF